MGILEDLKWGFTPLPFFNLPTDSAVPGTAATTEEEVRTARKHLLSMAAILGLGVFAPVVYTTLMSRRRTRSKKKKSAFEQTGLAMERGGELYNNLILTAIASPAIALPIAYIGVQKLEDGQIITKGLGNAVQTLMTVAVAAPLLQFGSQAVSAFAKKK